jgi:hypothetical protein
VTKVTGETICNVNSIECFTYAQTSPLFGWERGGNTQVEVLLIVWPNREKQNQSHFLGQKTPHFVFPPADKPKPVSF